MDETGVRNRWLLQKNRAPFPDRPALLSRLISRYLFVLVSALICGCAFRVVTSGFEFAPDKSAELAVVVRTAPGVGYTDLGEKTVNISISVPGHEPNTYLFAKQYKFLAARLEWSIEWIGPERVCVELYSYPPGVFPSSAETVRNRNSKDRAGTKHVATLEFVRQDGAKNFEQAK